MTCLCLKSNFSKTARNFYTILRLLLEENISFHINLVNQLFNRKEILSSRRRRSVVKNIRAVSDKINIKASLVMTVSDQISPYHLFPFLYVFMNISLKNQRPIGCLGSFEMKHFSLWAAKVLWKKITSRFWESKLVFYCMFLVIYCHVPTFAVNGISKFLNTCFTSISYHIWQRHLQFRCAKAVRRYLKRPPFI